MTLSMGEFVWISNHQLNVGVVELTTCLITLGREIHCSSFSSSSAPL